MAAMTQPSGIAVRAAMPGEGVAIAGLWRELWDAHEEWGGYAGSRDSRVYEQLAVRLEQDARVRAGQPVLGRHVHLVAAVNGVVAGQVEGWFERHGVDASTPYTCEVRSLIVRATMRGTGTGRALLDALAETAADMGYGSPVILAAEVLEPNPAHTFYARVGYAPVSWTARIDTDGTRGLVASASGPATAYAARIGEPRDALSIALLESTLASRRRVSGDIRFDRPRAIDATFVGSIAAHLANGGAGHDPLELVAIDRGGAVRGAASFAVSSLEPPFVPSRRAMVGRFAVDPALAPGPIVLALIALGCKLAAQRGAVSVELTDLAAPHTPLYEGVLATGARPWSRIVTKMAV